MLLGGASGMAVDLDDLKGSRVLLVGRSEGHFTYYDSIIEALLDRGAQVALWYVQGWTDKNDAALKSFRLKRPDLQVDWVPRRDDLWRRLAFALRELRSFAWYLRRSDASAFYIRRWQGYLSGWLGRAATSRLGRRILRRPTADRLFALAERLIPPFPDAVERLRRFRPDVVIVSPSNMRFSEEVEYVKACRSLGLPVAVLVQTWDSLTTKGLLQIVPDVLLVWHGQHRRAARDLHGIAEGRVRIVGAPFFDKWLREVGASTEADAANRPAPYVLYLGSSKNIAVDEAWVAKALRRAFEQHWHPMMRRVEVQIRPHPANLRPFKAIEGDGLRVARTSLPQDSADTGEFLDLARGALAVVGINTSGMLDTVILDCPTIALRLDEYLETQIMTPHFQAMVASGAMYEEASFEAAADRVMAIWRGDDDAAAARRHFRKNMIWPGGAGVTAGGIVASVVGELSRRGAAGGSGRHSVPGVARTAA